MSSLANSPVPPPSVATDVAHSPLFGLLSSAVEVQVVTPGVMFAPARPQLLPSHVPYKDVLRELPHIGYVDVLIDVSGDDIDDEYSSPEGFAFRTAWIADSAGSRAILHAVTALTPVDHFAFSARDGAWLPAEDVWRDGLPPAVADAAGPGAVLLAFAHVVRDLFVGERIPGALTTRYGTCAHCPGCHTYASVAAQAASLRSMLAASAASLQVWPDATPERIVAASRLLRFPVMPHVACSSRAADTASSVAPPAEVVEVAATVAGEKRNRSEATAPPESTDGAARRSSATVPPSWVPRSPAGVLSGSTAAAWRALCAPGAPPAAALPLWDGLLHPELIRALVAPPGGRGVPGLLREEIPGAAWSFPLFTAAACGAVMDVAEQHEAFARRRGVRVTRPNSMNRYGVILRACGLEPFIRALTHAALAPIAEAALPLETLPGGGFTRSHSFIVAYDALEGRDRALDMHTDDSDVTFNVCLGKDFEGASLTFCGALGARDHRKRTLTYSHEVGRCIVHRGLQRHGADAITAGHRRNLIVWLSNATFSALPPCRVARWEAEASGVDPVCVSFTHDRDYEARTGGPPPPGAVRGEHPWCPHPDGSTVRIK